MIRDHHDWPVFCYVCFIRYIQFTRNFRLPCGDSEREVDALA